MVQDFILRALTSDFFKSRKKEEDLIDKGEDLFASIKKYAVSIADIKENNSFNEIFLTLLSGNTIILLEDCERALATGTAGWEDRSVMLPESEAVVRGPREAFTENIRTNTALIRRKIKNPNLWLQTKERYCYRWV